MVYSSVSTKISNYLAKEGNYSEEQKDILAYGLECIILTVLGFIVVTFVGFLLGVWKETFFAALAGGILRKMSGGAHASTPTRCLINGTVCYSMSGWIANILYLWAEPDTIFLMLIVLTAFTLFMIFRYAPVDSKAKPIVSKSFRKKLHVASVITLVIFLSLAWTSLDSAIGIAIILGLTAQSASLLPALNQKR